MSIKNLALAATIAFSAGATDALATTVYESNFPTGSFGGPCSPCGTNYRVFDRVDLGTAGLTLTGIDFAIHDITPGGADKINVSIFDGAENLLHSSTQARGEWTVASVIDFDNYVVSFDLADWLVDFQVVWVSIFGVNGTQFGLSERGGGDGFATQLIGTGGTGFVAAGGNRNDVAMRIYGEEVAPVPLPAGGLLMLTGLGAMAFLRRRKTA